VTPKQEFILGISAFYHDSAACLMRDGEIVAAAQGRSTNRVRSDPARRLLRGHSHVAVGREERESTEAVVQESPASGPTPHRSEQTARG
jgi:predicted NodU family carbamoyl transferase